MSLLSGIVGAITGFVTGGPAGAVIGGVTGFAGGSSPSPGTSMVPSAPRPTPLGFGTGQISVGGGATIGPTGVNVGYGVNFGSPGTAVAKGGTCPPGFHLNKHALAPSKRHGAVPARSICVRNRHLNPLNPRALTHALRREKRARKLIGKLHVYRPVAGRAVARSGHRAGCGCAVCRRR